MQLKDNFNKNGGVKTPFKIIIMRTQADDLRDQIEFLEYDLKLVNPELCPRYCRDLVNEIMDLRSILINIQ